MYWIMLYRAMNLNTQNEVMRAARPSLDKKEEKKTTTTKKDMDIVSEVFVQSA